MKKLFPVIIAALLLTYPGKTFSQTFEVPDGYTLNTKDDYAKYEKDIIAASKWLIATPLNEQQEKRKEVSKFLVTWVLGSPTVNCELNDNIINFDKKNPGMMALFMAGCARYVLENNYSKDMRAKHRAALGWMIEVYKSDKGIKKDKKMEKLVEANDAGKIDEWLAENLKVNN